jgi:hypothetical protein
LAEREVARNDRGAQPFDDALGQRLRSFDRLHGRFLFGFLAGSLLLPLTGMADTIYLTHRSVNPNDAGREG